MQFDETAEFVDCFAKVTQNTTIKGECGTTCIPLRICVSDVCMCTSVHVCVRVIEAFELFVVDRVARPICRCRGCQVCCFRSETVS